MSISFLPFVLGFLAVITVVVFVHELGHYSVARWCGVKIEAFSIGFGRELFGFTDRRGTRWSFSAMPLGGYVKFIGDENAASVPTAAQADRPHDPDLLQFRPVWQRAAVLAAGPLASLLLAVVVFAGLAMVYGVHSIQPIVGGAVEGSPAAAAGLKRGDVIRAIDGRRVTSFGDIPQIVTTAGGRELAFAVERNGRELMINITPRREHMFAGIPIVMALDGRALEISGSVENTKAAKDGLTAGDRIKAINGTAVRGFGDIPRFAAARDAVDLVFTLDRAGVDTTVTVKLRGDDDEFRQAQDVWRIGVRPVPANEMIIKTERVGPIGALAHGVDRTVFVAVATFTYIRDVIWQRVSPNQIGGVVRMIDVSGRVAKRSVWDLIPLAALISASVGLMNLLPFLPLDGGHLVNHAYEALRGRPMSGRSQEMQALFGLSFVFALMMFAFYNDLTIVHRWVFS